MKRFLKHESSAAACERITKDGVPVPFGRIAVPEMNAIATAVYRKTYRDMPGRAYRLERFDAERAEWVVAPSGLQSWPVERMRARARLTPQWWRVATRSFMGAWTVEGGGPIAVKRSN